MLTYSLEDRDGESRYERLYRCISRDIAAGRLLAGEQLPSKRTFARHLGVSLAVVEGAYAQLQAEGYIRSEARRGYFVEELAVTPEPSRMDLQPARSPIMRKRADAPVCGTGISTDSSTRCLPAVPEPFADFVTSAVDVRAFPHASWARTQRNVLATEDERELLLASPPAGLPVLRRAIARHLEGFRGVHVDPDCIIIGAGTQFLYQLLVQLLGRNVGYAVEDPGYRRLGLIYEANGARVHYLPMDGYGLRMDRLEECGADIVHVMPSHQFPTGIVMPVMRRYELLGWANERPGRYIIEDDHDCEFRLAGMPIPTLQSIDLSERVIYLNTFSRSLAPTFRVSYMILPPHLAMRFRAELGFYSCSVSNFEQLCLARFIEEGSFDRHLARMRGCYRGKRDELIGLLAEGPLGPHMTVQGRECGLHFLMDLDTERSDVQLVAEAAARGVAISCLSTYYHDDTADGRPRTATPEGRHVVVLNYAGVERDVLPRAAQALSGICGEGRTPCSR